MQIKMLWFQVSWLMYFIPTPLGMLGNYRQTSDTSHTLVGNKIVDNSDVVGASPVGVAPIISSFST